MRIELPPGLPLLNLNDRSGYDRLAIRRKAAIRRAAHEAAKAQSPVTPFSEVHLECIFRPPDNRTRSVLNLAPSWQAVIDGLVDAGVLVSSSSKIVMELSMMLGENNPDGGQLVVQVYGKENDWTLTEKA